LNVVNNCLAFRNSPIRCISLSKNCTDLLI